MPAVSIHERIRSDIEGRILSGAWPPGHRVPFEHELSAEYSCSRMTVNKALSALAGAGFIERRRKAGSFVTRPPSRSAVLEIPDIMAEVLALGAAYRFEVLRRSRRRATRADSGHLEGIAAAPVLELLCRHWAGDRPFCLEERLINLKQSPEAEQEPFEAVAPGPWLLAQAPWTAAEHRIRARTLGAVHGELLEAPKETPCLSIERRTWSGATPVTFVRLTYPGERHELVARFSPGQR